MQRTFASCHSGRISTRLVFCVPVLNSSKQERLRVNTLSLPSKFVASQHFFKRVYLESCKWWNLHLVSGCNVAPMGGVLLYLDTAFSSILRWVWYYSTYLYHHRNELTYYPVENRPPAHEHSQDEVCSGNTQASVILSLPDFGHDLPTIRLYSTHSLWLWHKGNKIGENFKKELFPFCF